MHKKVQLGPGDHMDTGTMMGFNRTGATAFVGMVAALNLDYANATYITNNLTIPETDPRANVVAITAENQFMEPVVCKALGPLNGAAGDMCEWVRYGDYVDIKVPNGTAVGDILCAADNAGTVTAGQAANYANRAALDAIALQTKVLGYAMTANATGAAANVKARYVGCYGAVIGGGA